MGSIKLILSAFLLVSVFFASCKQDSESVGEDNTMGATLAVKNENKVDELFYTVEQRAKDSLQLMQKLASNGDAVDPAEVTSILNKTEEAHKQKMASKSNGDIDAVAKPRGLRQVCSMVSKKDIAEWFDVSAAAIKENSGNKGSVPQDKSSSCFWRWGDLGVLAQISPNPFPDEVDDWSTRYINTKKSSGEKSINSPDKRSLFVDFDGPGDKNIYNAETGRYYVAKGEDYIISLIFNGNMKKSKQLSIAKKMLASIYEGV